MPRQRNRQPGPIRRAQPAVSDPSDTRPARNLLARVQSDQPLTGLAPRRTRVGTHGQAGPWSQSMYLRPTDAAMTPAWSYTRSNRKV